MQFLCNANKLKESINIVEKAVSQKSTLPVLENIYLEIKNNSLKLRGNNLEIGIENDCQIESEFNEGSILVKAKTISGIMSKIDDEQLTISIDDSNKMKIKG